VRRVIIESPFGKNPDGSPADDATIARNVRYLKACLADSIRRGEAPFASHGLYPGSLDDRNPAERKMGMEAGWAWHEVADAVIVYEDLGITPGMLAGVANAQKLGKSVEYRRLPNRPLLESLLPARAEAS